MTRDWGTGVPAYADASGRFSGVLTGTITITNHHQGYVLHLIGDDKARLYIDDQLFLDGWTSPAGDKGTVTLTFTDGGTPDGTPVTHR